MAQKVRTLNEIRPTVTEYNEAVLDFYTQQTLDELPPKLEELWEFGVPLASDDEVIKGVKERRQALLQFWDSRTENPWGMRVRAAVEIFIREVVQYSPNHFPSDEVRVFNESGTSEAALNLEERPWDELSRQLQSESPEPN